MSIPLGLGIAVNKIGGAKASLAPNQISGNQLWLDASDTDYLNAKGAASFNSADADYLSTSNAAFKVGDQDFSFGGWVYFNALGSTETVIARNNPTGDNRSYVLFKNSSNQIKVQISSDGTAGASTSVGTTTVTAATWHFIVAVYDSFADILKVSINGSVWEAVSITGGAYAGSTAELTISNGAFNGRTDQIFFYTKALTYDDVLSIYNGGTGRDYEGAIAETSISSVAASFDAANTEYLNSTNSAFNFTTTSPHSWCGWVYLNSLGINQCIVSNRGSVGEGFLFLVLTTDTVDILIQGSSTAADRIRISTTDTLSVSTWYHLAYTYDGSKTAAGLKIYINGSQAATSVVNDALTGSSYGIGSYAMGGQPTYTAVWLDGRLNEAAQYNVEISSSVVSSLYNSGNGKSYGDLSGTDFTGLLAYWSLRGSGTRCDYRRVYNLTDNNTVTSAAGKVTPSVDLTSPTAWWEMDELSGNRADSSGNGYTLTDNNTVGFALGKVTSEIDNNDGVWRWVDKSSNGYVFQQDTASAQPQFALNYLASKNYIVFDGIDDFLQYQTGAWRSGDNLGTFYCVFEHQTGQASVPFAASNSAAASDFFRIGSRNTNVSTAGSTQGGVGDSVDGTTVLQTERYIVGYAGSGSAWSIRLNGTSESLTVIGSNNGEWLNDVSGYNTAAIGAIIRTASTFAVLKISEIIYFNKVLSTDEIAGLETYLADKHSITIP